jgi:hypothetical protein
VFIDRRPLNGVRLREQFFIVQQFESSEIFRNLAIAIIDQDEMTETLKGGQ